MSQQWSPPPPSPQADPSSAPSYQPGAALYNSPQNAPNQNQAGMKADPILRLGSWLIDGLTLMVIAIPLIVVGLIPFIGWIILWLGIPVVLVSYHLLRDIKGQSPGKYLLGMKVIGKDGREAPNQSRVMRNLLFAIPPVFFILPFIGHFIGGLLMFVIVLTECITLLATGERIGDKIANTVVVKTK
jgi:uncharacterized RDD family membrane protein YckC